MQREQHQPQAELEAALHARGQEVEGEHSHRQHSKQGEPLVEPQEVLVQEGSHGGLNNHVQDDVDDPDDRDERRYDAKHEPDNGRERVVPGRAWVRREGRREEQGSGR